MLYRQAFEAEERPRGHNHFRSPPGRPSQDCPLCTHRAGLCVLLSPQAFLEPKNKGETSLSYFCGLCSSGGTRFPQGALCLLVRELADRPVSRELGVLLGPGAPLCPRAPQGVQGAALV